MCNTPTQSFRHDLFILKESQDPFLRGVIFVLGEKTKLQLFHRHEKILFSQHRMLADPTDGRIIHFFTALSRRSY